MDWVALDADQTVGGVLIMWAHFRSRFNGKVWRTVLFGHVQGCIARTITI